MGVAFFFDRAWEAMGLYIHTPLESINVHRKLLQLERGAEIATGLMRLQQLLEEDNAPPPPPHVLRALQSVLAALPQGQLSEAVEDLGERLLYDIQQGEKPLSGEGLAVSLPDGEEFEGIKEALNDADPQGVDLIPEHALQYLLTLRRSQRVQIEEQQRLPRKNLPEQLSENEQREAYEQKLGKAWTQIRESSESARRRMLQIRSFLRSFPSDHRFGNPYAREAAQQLEQLKRARS